MPQNIRTIGEAKDASGFRAALVLAAGIACAVGPAHAVDKSWLGGTQQWTTPTNWFPNGLPGSTDTARIGNLAGVSNGTVTLNASLQEIGGLVITNGMHVISTTSLIFNHGNTLISGKNTVSLPGGNTIYRSRLEIGGVSKGGALRTDTMLISDGARFWLKDGVGARIYVRLAVGSDSEVRGDGTINLYGAGTTLVNSGRLLGGTGLGLRLIQHAGGVFDLDGISGDGELHASSYNTVTNQGGRIQVEGTGLTESFSGSIRTGSDSDVFMNLSNGWVADAASELRHDGSPHSDAPGLLRGAALDIYGLVTVNGGANGRLQLRPSTLTMRPGAVVQVGPDARLELGIVPGSDVVVRGGDYTAGPGGEVSFNGLTEWRGQASFAGLARQNLTATVAAATVINADRFDLDGLGGVTTWQISSSLVLNAERIEEDGQPHAFNGVLNVGAGFLGQLTVNLSDADDVWEMAGQMNLIGAAQAAFPLTRLGGSDVVVTGELNVQHSVRVNADMSLEESASMMMSGPNSRVQFTGRTVLTGGASLSGLGTIENGPSGSMTIGAGSVLGEIGLFNDGKIDFGSVPGLVSVPSFENTSSGDWIVTIGGPAPGSDHDLMTVALDQAILAGRISVRLTDLGDGAFVPHIGDEFTVLTAVGGVTGSFANDPVSVSDGLAYHWTVLYEPNAVVLRLDNIDDATCEADLNGDGLVNFFDLAVFVALYNAQDPAADLAPAFGAWTFFDFAEYINIYSSGCP